MLPGEGGERVGETPWDATFEVSLTFPPGRQLIEIKVNVPEAHALETGILSDWVVEVPPPIQ